MPAINNLVGRVAYPTIEHYLMANRALKHWTPEDEYKTLQVHKGPILMSGAYIMCKLRDEIGRLVIRMSKPIDIAYVRACQKDYRFLNACFSALGVKRFIVQVMRTYLSAGSCTEYFTVKISIKNGWEIKFGDKELWSPLSYDKKNMEYLLKNAFRLRFFHAAWHPDNRGQSLDDNNALELA